MRTANITTKTSRQRFGHIIENENNKVMWPPILQQLLLLCCLCCFIIHRLLLASFCWGLLLSQSNGSCFFLLGLASLVCGCEEIISSLFTFFPEHTKSVSSIHRQTA